MKNSLIYNVLKITWARHRPVRMTEVDDKIIAFDFESERDREQIMDMDPWSVQGHSLNLKECKANICIKEIDFHLMQM